MVGIALFSERDRYRLRHGLRGGCEGSCQLCLTIISAAAHAECIGQGIAQMQRAIRLAQHHEIVHITHISVRFSHIFATICHICTNIIGIYSAIALFGERHLHCKIIYNNVVLSTRSQTQGWLGRQTAIIDI